MAIDASQKLIFVGDNKRVKLYAWESPNGEFYTGKPLPMHTLDSTDITGPMVVLPNGTIIQAGEGEASVWDINSLPTHGPNGKKRIGNQISIADTWHDDLENMERSSGSVPSHHIMFINQLTLAPGV